MSAVSSVSDRVEEAYGAGIPDISETFEDHPKGSLRRTSVGVLVTPDCNVNPLDDTEKLEAIGAIIKKLVVCADEYKEEYTKGFSAKETEPLSAEIIELIAHDLSKTLIEGEEFWRPKEFEEEGGYASVQLERIPTRYKGYAMPRWLGQDALSVRLLEDGSMVIDGFGDAPGLEAHLSDPSLMIASEQPAPVPSIHFDNSSSRIKFNVAKLNKMVLGVAQSHELDATPLQPYTFRPRIGEEIKDVALHSTLQSPGERIGLKLAIQGVARVERAEGETGPIGYNTSAEFVSASDEEYVVLPRSHGRASRDGYISINSHLGSLDARPEEDNITRQYHPFLMTDTARKMNQATDALFESLAECLDVKTSSW